MSDDTLGSNLPGNFDSLLTQGRRLQVINLHGLFRAVDQELGGPDTGGQTKYILEQCQALGQAGLKVDIFTRLFRDRSSSYAVPIETHGNVRIVRVPFGGPNFLLKEELWNVLDEAIAEIVAFNEARGTVPLAFHGHLAMSGFVGMELAQHYSVPLLFTGHSFGIPKRDSLVEGTDIDLVELEHRIQVETTVMQRADRIVCNSVVEIEEQISLYGDFASKSIAISPGVSSAFYSAFTEEPGNNAERRVRGLIEPFLKQPEKPIVLTIARPDPKKNLVW
jgi:sucrose-phosphate synthase